MKYKAHLSPDTSFTNREAPFPSRIWTYKAFSVWLHLPVRAPWEGVTHLTLPPSHYRIRIIRGQPNTPGRGTWKLWISTRWKGKWAKQAQWKWQSRNQPTETSDFLHLVNLEGVCGCLQIRGRGWKLWGVVKLWQGQQVNFILVFKRTSGSGNYYFLIFAIYNNCNTLLAITCGLIMNLPLMFWKYQYITSIAHSFKDFEYLKKYKFCVFWIVVSPICQKCVFLF